jgi:hypothetical protein
MDKYKTMSGWIVFAAWLMLIIGGLDFFEGLIAVIRKNYYVVSGNQVIVFNVTTWGWLTLLWGIVLILVGLALFAGADWARWVAIVLVSLNLLEQLAFLGNSGYPLWTLTSLALTFMVLYALIVRWDGSEELPQTT